MMLVRGWRCSISHGASRKAGGRPKATFYSPDTLLKKADKSSHCSISIVPPSHMSKKPVRHAHDFKSQGEKKKKKNITFSDLIIDCLQHWDKNIIMDESRDGKCHGANVV